MPYDFTFTLAGPRTATPGYPIFLQIGSKILEGTRDYVNYSNDPSSPLRVSFPTLRNYPGRGVNNDYAPANQILRVDIPKDILDGKYPVEINIASGDIHKTAVWEIEVKSHLYITTPPEPNLPSSLNNWESNMLYYGNKLGNKENIERLGTWEGNIWYYDGLRVFQQIAEYTGDDKWYGTAEYPRKVYVDYIRERDSANANFPGWRVFPKGLYDHYTRTGNHESADCILILLKRAAFLYTPTDPNYGGLISVEYARENAYMLDLLRYGQKLGVSNPIIEKTLACCLGILDQWSRKETKLSFGSEMEDYYIQPWQAGLVMESLIAYYEEQEEENKDPRILPAITKMLDFLWDNYWVGTGFPDDTKQSTNAAPNANLLIAPAYAWAYLKTGWDRFKERGETIFNNGVELAWIDQGKQFSQNYRWSFDYIKWSQPIIKVPAPQPSPAKQILQDIKSKIAELEGLL